MQAAKNDSSVIVVCAATPFAFGFTQDWRQKLGKQYTDVGIAEEHAVAMASGIAKAGGKPIVCICATFLQRSYDQLLIDLCLNNNPALILIYSAGLYGMNDATHIGHFDIQELAHIPNLLYLVPTSTDEYTQMLNWGIQTKSHPVAIRIPATLDTFDYRTEIDFKNLHYNIIQKGKDIAVIAMGTMLKTGEKIANEYHKTTGKTLTLINPLFVSDIDRENLSSLLSDHRLVITIEDGILEGGWGEKIAMYYSDKDMDVKCYGLKKVFADNYSYADIRFENKLTAKQILQEIINYINNHV